MATISDKWAGWSKTILAAIGQLLVLGTVLGVQVSQEDITETNAALAGGAGAILTLLNVYGRVTAKGGVYFNPFK